MRPTTEKRGRDCPEREDYMSSLGTEAEIGQTPDGELVLRFNYADGSTGSAVFSGPQQAIDMLQDPASQWAQNFTTDSILLLVECIRSAFLPETIQ